LGHILNFLIQNRVFLRIFEEFTLLANSYPLFAEGAQAEVKEDSRGEPFDLETFFRHLTWKICPHPLLMQGEADKAYT
jgi:hypothetical protein